MGPEESGAPPGARRLGDGFTAFLTLACLALAVLVALLAWQNLRLKRTVAELRRSAAPAGALAPGDRFVPPVLAGADGAERAVDFAASRTTVLLVFSSRCPACAETLPKWRALVPAYTGRPGLDVLGVEIDAGANDASAIPPGALGFPVYTVVRDGASLDKIPYIPAVVLVDAAGTVTWTLYGIPNESAIDEMRKRLDEAAQAGS